MWQLLQALKFLHANNVWHRCVSFQCTSHVCLIASSTMVCLGEFFSRCCRDIKSSNIMVTRAQGHRIVKVRPLSPATPLWTSLLFELTATDSISICCMLNMQVGDFGSARSATSEGYHWAEQGPPISNSDAVLLKSRRQVTLCVHAQPYHCCGISTMASKPQVQCYQTSVTDAKGEWQHTDR